jgi:putative tricarboxylic transport membrane protein
LFAARAIKLTNLVRFYTINCIQDQPSGSVGVDLVVDMKAILRKAASSLASHPDRLSGSIVILAAGFAIFEASRLPFGTLRTPDAGFFPLCLSALLLVAGAAIVLRSFTTPTQSLQFTPQTWYVPVAAITFVLYAFTVQTVGFVLSTIAALLLLMRGLGGMSWTRAVIISVPAVALSYLGFRELGVPLPRGFLPF